MSIIIDVAGLVVMTFLGLGIANRVKAIAAGRRGPSLFQPFSDFVKLLRKGEVISRTATFIFRIAPALGLAAALTAALFVPLASGRPLVAFDGDFVLFVYLLGLAKFLSLAAARDTGSSFEDMGASREASFSVLVEPAFFLLLGTLALITGQTSFAALFRLIGGNVSLSPIVIPLAALTLFLLILIEGGRGPVDDPATHLELTMIHEVMVLDNSGPDLAFIQSARGLKTLLYSSLIANLFLPLIPGTILPVAAWFVIVALIAVAVGVIESVLARTRMTHIPQFIFIMTSLALIVLFTAIFITSNVAGGRP